MGWVLPLPTPDWGGGGGLGKGSRTVRARKTGPYLQVGNRHWDIGNRLSDRLGLVGKILL